MKYISSLFILFFSLSLIAQEEIKVDYHQHEFKDGVRPAFISHIPEASFEIVEKDLRKRLNDLTKEKGTSDGMEWTFVGIDIKEFKNDTIVVTAGAYQREDGVLLALGFVLDGAPYDFELNKHGKKGCERIVREFALEAYRDKVKDDLDHEKDVLVSYEKRHKQTFKEEEKLIKENRIAERNITNTEEEIEQFNQEQKLHDKEIMDLKEQLINGNMEPEAKAATEKRIKELKSDKKKLLKKEEKAHSDIDGYEYEIREIARKKADLLSERENLVSMIDQQKLIVDEVSTKLNSIK